MPIITYPSTFIPAEQIYVGDPAEQTITVSDPGHTISTREWATTFNPYQLSPAATAVAQAVVRLLFDAGRPVTPAMLERLAAILETARQRTSLDTIARADPNAAVEQLLAVIRGGATP